MITKFTVEEMNLLYMYNVYEKEELENEIRADLSDINDPDMIDIMVEVIAKLNAMSEDEFYDLDHSAAYDDLDEWEE